MIYRLKVTTDVSKNFLRVYEIKDAQTLYDLHEHILADLGYAPDQMIEFRTFDNKHQPGHEYGLFDMGDGSIDTVTMQDLKKDGETVMLYVFDLHNDRSLRIEIAEEDEESSRKVYPLTIEDKGVAPDQFDAHQKEEKELPVSRKPAPIGDNEDNDDDLDDMEDDLEEDEENEIDDDDEQLDDNYGGMFGSEDEEK